MIADDDRPSVSCPRWRRGGVLVVASLGVLLAGAELMVVAIALPAIVIDFGGWADLGRASWIVNGYLLAFVVAMPIAGRAADLWGARRLYVVALLLFAVGEPGQRAGAVRRTAGRDRLAHRGAGRPGAWRRRPGAALHGAGLAPVRRSGSRAALGVEGAAAFVGMAVGPAYGAWVLLTVSVPAGWTSTRGSGSSC